MKTRTMYIVAFGVYLLFLLAFAMLVMFYRGNEDAMVMGMSLLSSALMVVTLILAVIFMRRSPSERYEDRYTEKANGDWEKK